MGRSYQRSRQGRDIGRKLCPCHLRTRYLRAAVDVECDIDQFVPTTRNSIDGVALLASLFLPPAFEQHDQNDGQQPQKEQQAHSPTNRYPQQVVAGIHIVVCGVFRLGALGVIIGRRDRIRRRKRRLHDLRLTLVGVLRNIFRRRLRFGRGGEKRDPARTRELDLYPSVHVPALDSDVVQNQWFIARFLTLGNETHDNARGESCAAAHERHRGGVLFVVSDHEVAGKQGDEAGGTVACERWVVPGGGLSVGEPALVLQALFERARHTDRRRRLAGGVAGGRDHRLGHVGGVRKRDAPRSCIGSVFVLRREGHDGGEIISGPRGHARWEQGGARRVVIAQFRPLTARHGGREIEFFQPSDGGQPRPGHFVNFDRHVLLRAAHVRLQLVPNAPKCARSIRIVGAGNVPHDPVKIVHSGQANWRPGRQTGNCEQVGVFQVLNERAIPRQGRGEIARIKWGCQFIAQHVARRVLGNKRSDDSSCPGEYDKSYAQGNYASRFEVPRPPGGPNQQGNSDQDRNLAVKQRGAPTQQRGQYVAS